MVVDDLEQALGEELRLHKALLELAERKRGALVAVDTAAVDAITRREQSVLLALGTTAASRLQLSAETAKSLGLPEDATVTAIAQRVPALRGVAGELRTVLTELGRVTRQCRALTEESLGFVKRFFRILSTAGQEQSGYTRRGAPPAAPPPRLMIDQVV